MTDNRTGLGAADIAEQFRDVCGDGSMEWVTGPMQARLLLDVADMLDENTRLRSCLTDAAENARLIMGENAKLRRDLEEANSQAEEVCIENTKLRELVWDMWEGYNDPRCEECHLKDTPTCADCPICAREASVIDRMRELGVVE